MNCSFVIVLEVLPEKVATPANAASPLACSVTPAPTKKVPSDFAVVIPARVVLKELSPLIQVQAQQPIVNVLLPVAEGA